MALEIERRFLVISDAWLRFVNRRYWITQTYLAQNNEINLRVRVSEHKAWLAIKSGGAGRSRREYEYPIPTADAAELVAGASLPAIEKWRHEVMQDAHLWEVDVYEGANAGLIVAEIELKSPDEDFSRPAWVGREVTDDLAYRNISLALRPYSLW